MKTQKPNRIIRSHHGGTFRDGPKLGPVARVRDPKGPQKIGWTRRRGGYHGPEDVLKRSARNRLLWVWSMAFAVTAFMIIAGFAVFWVRSHRAPRAPESSRSAAPVVRIASRFASPTEDEALELVRKSLSNRDPEMVDATVRRGGTEPAKVVEFMDSLESRDGPINRIAWLGSMDVDGFLMEGVLVVSAGKNAPAERLAFLVPDDSGVWKLDFDAFARTCTPTWKELLEGDSQSAVVRVIVGNDSYFNGPFRDESQWECFALVAKDAKKWLPGGQDLLRGYCRKGSPQAKAIARIFKDDAKMRRVTLEIQRTEGADSRQFEITRVLAEDWVLQAQSLDEKFD